jgi:hypothetical protein
MKGTQRDQRALTFQAEYASSKKRMAEEPKVPEGKLCENCGVDPATHSVPPRTKEEYEKRGDLWLCEKCFLEMFPPK